MKQQLRKVSAGVAWLVVALPAAADSWSWGPSFTEASAPALTQLHESLVGPTLVGPGVPVQNARWAEEGIEILLESGTLWLEPEVQGVRPGAYFEGQGMVRIAPDGRRAGGAMTYWFGSEQLDGTPITRAYFFTARAKDLAQQLEIGETPTVPLADASRYVESKKVFRQLGLAPLTVFLNRTGRAQGAAFVLIAPELIRASGSPNAYLLYSFDPSLQDAIELAAFAHDDVVQDPTFKHFFAPLVRTRSVSRPWLAQARVTEYATRLSMLKRMTSTDLETTIRLAPNAGARALALTLNPRLKVSSVRSSDGAPLPFAQWNFLDAAPNPDPTVIVDFGAAPAAGAALQLTVAASGPLFDPFGDSWALADEDTWYPQLEDPQGADYALTVQLPKGLVVVAPGKKLQDDVAEGLRTVRFKTTRPQRGTTLYVGSFEVLEGKADDTRVEVYSDRNRPSRVVGYDPEMAMEVVAQGTSKNDVDYSRQEIENAIKIYNRILVPLDLAELRVAATPTGHGRGFEGLLLLSKFGGFDSDDSRADLFRAHEVAHLWWGNMVDGRHWPEDRWLSESFAEYMAMEFYTLRFKKPAKTHEWMQQQWVKPILDASQTAVRTLDGSKRRVRASELRPIIDGTQNVYTKGPLLLHMLRNLFVVFKQSDEPFWALMQEFLEKNKGQQVSTDDFIAAAEAKLGGRIPWFWDQWLYGSDVPSIKWSSSIAQSAGGWIVTVDARQVGTPFSLALPVYVEMGDGKKARQFLDLSQATGRAVVKVPSKPRSVTVNDNFEVLASIEKE